MKSAILYILTVIYFISIGGLALYGIHRIWLLLFWWRQRAEEKRFAPEEQTTASTDKIPFVTVQIPLYNEPLVAARIVDAAASFRWPADRLEVQILDDSSDSTGKTVVERIEHWRREGVNIYGIFRKKRDGYKAGALQNGLMSAQGELVAIFDADFVPPPDFLEKTVPYFRDRSVGMVQTRWGFLNSRYSWLTRLQTLMLSPHFGIEHRIRASRNLFFNFNGTAGIWRREAIESAGGWQSDTVTEDLDLSYRAQLAGWRFVYLNDVVVPSELPIKLADFRSQQERWSKGSTQTAVKILPKILASHLPFSVKMESVAHLMANCCWLLGFAATMTLYPVILYRIGIGMYQVLWIDLPLFAISSGAIITYHALYALSTKNISALAALPLLPLVSIGIAPAFALSVLKGFFSRGGIFERTPKSGALDSETEEKSKSASGIQKQQKYTGKSRPELQSSQKRSKANRIAADSNMTASSGNQELINLGINFPLLLYSLVPVIFTWQRETWPAIPFLSLFPLGFLIVLGSDLQSMLKDMSSGKYYRENRTDENIELPDGNILK